MRITIVADSATPAEVYALTLAFQRAQQDNEPLVLTSKPTVSVVGSALGWSTPPMSMVRAMSTLAHMGSGALTVPVEPPVNLADPARRNMAVYSDEAEADDIHAWFINEDGTPYMYERAEQQTAFPNDPPDAYQTIGEAEAAAAKPATWWDFEVGDYDLIDCDLNGRLKATECAGPRIGVERQVAPVSKPTGRVLCEKHINEEK